MTFKLDEEAMARFLKSAEVDAGIKGVGERLTERAKEKAPVANVNEDAKPGELRDSIKAEPNPDGGYLVGSDVPYAAYVEYGTVHMDARPFMRPAIDEIKAEDK